MFADRGHIKIYRKRSVSSEPFYVTLDVTEEDDAMYWAYSIFLQKNAIGWSDSFDIFKKGVSKRLGSWLQTVLKILMSFSEKNL